MAGENQDFSGYFFGSDGQHVLHGNPVFSVRAFGNELYHVPRPKRHPVYFQVPF